MKKLMIFMSAALLLSSCGLYNKYERPNVDTKGLVRDTVSLRAADSITNMSVPMWIRRGSCVIRYR